MNTYLLWYLILAGVSLILLAIAHGFDMARNGETLIGWSALVSVSTFALFWPLTWLFLIGWQIGKRSKE